MTAPRIVTPQEAQEWVADETAVAPDPQTGSRLVLTVATEPERIAVAERAAVVRVLRDFAFTFGDPDAERLANFYADGAPL